MFHSLEPRSGEKCRPTSQRRLLFLLSVLAALCVLSCGNSPKKRAPEAHNLLDGSLPPRFVSLSPGVTETLIALGARASLVGISDYCLLESEPQTSLQKMGSAITPNYERIAHARPTQILMSQISGDQLLHLNKIAPTTSLPWLTLKEWSDSVVRLGVIVNEQDKATALSSRIVQALDRTPEAKAPRILFALDYGDSGSNEVWFIRKNSIHGAALRAAGGKNAVARDIMGQPKLSPEQLLSLNPDAIIILRSAQPEKKRETQSLAFYKKWQPLSAVKNSRLAVLSVPGALTIGPNILDLVPQIRATIDKLFKASPLTQPQGSPK